MLRRHEVASCCCRKSGNAVSAAHKLYLDLSHNPDHGPCICVLIDVLFGYSSVLNERTQ